MAYTYPKSSIVTYTCRYVDGRAKHVSVSFRNGDKFEGEYNHDMSFAIGMISSLESEIRPGKFDCRTCKLSLTRISEEPAKLTLIAPQYDELIQTSAENQTNLDVQAAIQFEDSEQAHQPPPEKSTAFKNLELQPSRLRGIVGLVLR